MLLADLLKKIVNKDLTLFWVYGSSCFARDDFFALDKLLGPIDDVLIGTERLRRAFAILDYLHTDKNRGSTEPYLNLVWQIHISWFDDLGSAELSRVGIWMKLAPPGLRNSEEKKRWKWNDSSELPMCILIYSKKRHV